MKYLFRSLAHFKNWNYYLVPIREFWVFLCSGWKFFIKVCHCQVFSPFSGLSFIFFIDIIQSTDNLNLLKSHLPNFRLWIVLLRCLICYKSFSNQRSQIISRVCFFILMSMTYGELISMYSMRYQLKLYFLAFGADCSSTVAWKLFFYTDLPLKLCWESAVRMCEEGVSLAGSTWHHRRLCLCISAVPSGSL